MASARNQNAWANHNPATSAQALHSVSPTSLYPPSNSRNGPSSNPPLAYPQLSMPSFMTENTEYSTPSVVPGDRERMACHRSILEREEMLQSRPVNIDDYIKDLRRATLRVVEEVTAWRKCLNSSAPSLSLPSILSEGEGHLYPRKVSRSLTFADESSHFFASLPPLTQTRAHSHHPSGIIISSLSLEGPELSAEADPRPRQLPHIFFAGWSFVFPQSLHAAP